MSKKAQMKRKWREKMKKKSKLKKFKFESRYKAYRTKNVHIVNHFKAKTKKKRVSIKTEAKISIWMRQKNKSKNLDRS